jgi:Asp-tRNA(Asn)/Glu-tRNA(Gln) amidotransferase A subunit family amidase
MSPFDIIPERVAFIETFTTATGSSRRPAMANGAFQIRLTHNLIPLDNSVPSSPYVLRLPCR